MPVADVEMTAGMWGPVLLFGAALAALLAWVIWRDRKAAIRRQRWAEDYFRRGGLARALIGRWRGVPRLTDQRSTDKRTD